MGDQLTMFAPITAPSASIDDALLREEFEEFWREWRAPTRRRAGPDPKDLAFDRYRQVRRGTAKHPPASADIVLCGLRRSSFSADPMFRPMATTWLNQRRFLEVVDLDADPWGLYSWYDAQRATDALSAACYERDALELVMIATNLPRSWRGPLEALGAWLRDAIEPETIERAIGLAIDRAGARNSLQIFDAWVRREAGPCR